MAGKTISKTVIVKDKGGDWRVKAYDIHGNYLTNLDYFTDDRADAEATAADMVGKHAGSVLGVLLDCDWVSADSATVNGMDRLNVWGAHNCWSNYPATSLCGRDILGLWDKFRPFLSAIDPSVRPSAVRSFVEAADVLAFG